MDGWMDGRTDGWMEWRFALMLNDCSTPLSCDEAKMEIDRRGAAKLYQEWNEWIECTLDTLCCICGL
jgi:hypothetical protein